MALELVATAVAILALGSRCAKQAKAEEQSVVDANTAPRPRPRQKKKDSGTVDRRLVINIKQVIVQGSLFGEKM